MTIQILKKPVEESINQFNKVLDHEKEQDSKIQNLPSDVISDIKNILSDISVNNLIENINSVSYFDNFDYAALNELFETFDNLHSKIKQIREKVDIEIFLKEGYHIDIKKLRAKFKKNKLHKEFKNFNFERLSDLYKYPPNRLSTYYNEEEQILIDSFVFRKYIIAIIQMVFNQMDLLVCSTGPEGSGKSTKISQDMLMVHYILTEIGVINYEFDLKEIWFNSLPKFREAEDKYFSEPFRIIGLDEGNELNRQDWKDDEVRTFFQRLRRERYNRRLKFICLPVLGELIPNIVLSRMNFILNMINKNEVKTGTLDKGEYEFYIIPRGDKIYSPHFKKNFSRSYIKSQLYKNLKDKEYLKGMPREILIKKCFSNGVWGFKESEYIKELKETNKTFSVNKGISFGLTELFMFYKSRITMKKIGIKSKDIRYPSMSKIIGRINNFFYNDPDLMNKYESMYLKKQADKEDTETI